MSDSRLLNNCPFENCWLCDTKLPVVTAGYYQSPLP